MRSPSAGGAACRQALAYGDAEHILGGGRVLASPAAFAKLIQLAEIQHADSILDVGAGTGYSTAVLARLGAEVTGLESDPALVSAAHELLANTIVGTGSVVQGPLDGSSLTGKAYDVIVEEVETARETVSFRLPRVLAG